MNTWVPFSTPIDVLISFPSSMDMSSMRSMHPQLNVMDDHEIETSTTLSIFSNSSDRPSSAVRDLTFLNDSSRSEESVEYNPRIAQASALSGFSSVALHAYSYAFGIESEAMDLAILRYAFEFDLGADLSDNSLIRIFVPQYMQNPNSESLLICILALQYGHLKAINGTISWIPYSYINEF